MRPLLLCAVLAALTPAGAHADTLRCGDRIVGTEALAAEVLAVCGQPDYRDAWQSYDGEEAWTYNFGSNQLLRILYFRHGQLVSIDTDGYGFELPAASSCHPTDLLEGMSKYRLLARCGEPASQESFGGVLHPFRRRDGRVVFGSAQPVYRERWVYDLGPQYFQQIVTFENGRVTAVDSGARGRATPRE